MSVRLFAQCVADIGEDVSTTELLQCIGASLNEVSEGVEASASLANSFLLVLSAALVFFMQAGFAMLCAGAVRKKNVQNTMLKNLLDACGAAIAYFCVGYAFSFGGDDPSSSAKTFIGNTNFFLMDVEDLAFWLFQYAFSAASATIVAGTLAERCQVNKLLVLDHTASIHCGASSVRSPYEYLSFLFADGCLPLLFTLPHWICLSSDCSLALEFSGFLESIQY